LAIGFLRCTPPDVIDTTRISCDPRLAKLAAASAPVGRIRAWRTDRLTHDNPALLPEVFLQAQELIVERRFVPYPVALAEALQRRRD